MFESDLDDPRDVSGRGLDPDGVARDQLRPHQHRPEHHLPRRMEDE